MKQLSEATKRQVEALKWEVERKDCLRDIYQFLYAADNGMYGDCEDQETLVGDARVLRESMEYYFSSEITIDDDLSADYGNTTYSQEMQDDLEPIE